MPGTLNVGGHDIITHSGDAGAGDVTVNVQNRLVLDSSGNVGIGAASPRERAQVNYRLALENSGAFSENNPMGEIVWNANNGNKNAKIGAYQTVGTSGGYLAFSTRTNGDGVNTDGGSERMRIDSSGNLLVGKTSASTNTVGVEARPDGTFAAVKSAGGAAVFGSNTDDGTIVTFRKDSTNVGSIGTSGGRVYIADDSTNGITFSNSSAIMWPSNSSGGIVDNTMDIGSTSFRFDDIYATNGTIQTSDRNEKQDIEELFEAEQRVAVAAKALMRKFRWKSAVAKKGDEARIHFGIIAQDLQAAFEAEGLDAGRYAMFISSTWWETSETYTDDEGIEQTRTKTYDTAEEAPEGAVERTRLGVRYSELLAFIIAAI